ncbi:MAG: WG repeat-containing protein [Anaerolineaceae bacterium]|nr:WG repeat-containing protein [Anaerolineaceae bacterium]
MNKKRLSPRLLWIAITICLSLACSVFTSEPKSTPTQFPSVLLYPVFKSGKAGYINPSGTITIPIEYDDAINFSEGLAAIQQGEIWGYLNASGELVIPPSFDQAFSFHNGLAKVKVKE